MRQVRRRKRQRKKGLSLNALLWLTVISIILFYSVLNIKAITRTVATLSDARKTEKAPEDALNTEEATKDGATNQEVQEQAQEADETSKSATEVETTTAEEQAQHEKDTLSPFVYFVKINDDGSFSLVKKSRSIKKTQAVLSKTLEQLLKGTTETEVRSGLSHFFPEGSVVKSISVKNSVAYVSMSEEFQFNPFGQAALEAQIYQLVYTSTQFATIDKVQILIEGKKISYLSGEGGLFVGAPLAPSDLRSPLYKQ